MCLGEVARKISKFLMKLLNKTKSFLFFLITRQFEHFGAKRTGKDAKYHMNRLQDFMNCWGLVRAVKMSCNKVTKVFIILVCSFSLPSSSSCTRLVCPNHQLCLGDPDSEGVLGTVSFSSSGLKWWCLKPQIGTHILVSSAVNEEEMEVPRNGIIRRKGAKKVYLCQPVGNDVEILLSDSVCLPETNMNESDMFFWPLCIAYLIRKNIMLPLSWHRKGENWFLILLPKLLMFFVVVNDCFYSKELWNNRNRSKK